MSPGFRLITFTIRVNKRHPVNIILKKLVQRIIEARSVVSSKIDIKHMYPCFLAE